jgi:hypothetical protein
MIFGKIDQIKQVHGVLESFSDKKLLLAEHRQAPTTTEPL